MAALLLILTIVCGRATHLDYKNCYSYSSNCVKTEYAKKQIIEDEDLFSMVTYENCTEELQ